MEQAPKNLDFLLDIYKVQDPKVLEKMDKIIDGNEWYRKFHLHLTTRDLEDEINILKFLIAMKSLETIEKAAKMSKKQKESAKLKVKFMLKLESSLLIILLDIDSLKILDLCS